MGNNCACFSEEDEWNHQNTVPQPVQSNPQEQEMELSEKLQASKEMIEKQQQDLNKEQESRVKLEGQLQSLKEHLTLEK